MHNTITLRARRRRSQALNFLKALRKAQSICTPRNFQDFILSELHSGDVIQLSARKVVPTRIRTARLTPISLAA